jgi:hypothetical protein
MNPFKIISIVTTLSALVGCSHATLDKEDCLRGDWHNIGVQDGTAGKIAGELNLHREACAEYAVTPNQKQYMEGREEGLKEYCKLENAVTTGLNGELYQGVCPKEIDEAFRKQNLAAYNLYLMYMRNSYYNSYYYGGWGYPYYGGWGFYPSFGFGGYYGGHHRGFRPFGGFNLRGGFRF